MKPFSLEKWKKKSLLHHKKSLLFNSAVFFLCVSSALQAGRDESSHVDEAQAIIDAKVRVPPLEVQSVCVSSCSRRF